MAAPPQLQELESSLLYRRRHKHGDVVEERPSLVGGPPGSAAAAAACGLCSLPLDPASPLVASMGRLFHPRCFVCAQCFQTFPDGLFYEFEGRRYCEHDFQMLFAPCCGECGEFIAGRVIRAAGSAWHPACFSCRRCRSPLADAGFVRADGSNLCHACGDEQRWRRSQRHRCHRCQHSIDEEPLLVGGEPHHAHHFNCSQCGKELSAGAARETPGVTTGLPPLLLCLPCHDKSAVPICAACRRPVEERVVNALGKQWHVEHFVCARCEKPFFGSRHYERRGLAYCESHYNQMFGDVCYHCNHVIGGDVVSALNKAWCISCFCCSTCSTRLTLKNRFVEFDMKPVCKRCYEKFPLEMKKRLKRLSRMAVSK
ncbi:LIM and senescent cell antigen-like-containing domain protein 1 [Lampetra fluviatilis]